MRTGDYYFLFFALLRIHFRVLFLCNGLHACFFFCVFFHFFFFFFFFFDVDSNLARGNLSIFSDEYVWKIKTYLFFLSSYPVSNSLYSTNNNLDFFLLLQSLCTRRSWIIREQGEMMMKKPCSNS